MAIQKPGKKPSRNLGQRYLRFSPRKLTRLLLLLAFLAVIPPLFFHFRLRLLHQTQLQKCGWLANPPLVCAHGGDSSKAVPNTSLGGKSARCRLFSLTRMSIYCINCKDFEEFEGNNGCEMDAYRTAILNQVDCIEIDVSRSSDGILFALHDRDLQRISGNATAKVGYFNKDQIKGLDAGFQFSQEFDNKKVPIAEDALELISKSVKQVILDVKVGPPLFEKGLAADVLAVIKRTHCTNCLVWAKSDILGRDVIRLIGDVEVGYIVMVDPSTGFRNNILRMKDASVVGVYHPLIDEKLVRILHGYDLQLERHGLRRGKKVYAWTVDDDLSMQKMLLNRVDAIVTSQPTLLQRLIQDIKSQCTENGLFLP